jgi:hypothetical protein
VYGLCLLRGRLPCVDEDHFALRGDVVDERRVPFVAAAGDVLEEYHGVLPVLPKPDLQDVRRWRYTATSPVSVRYVWATALSSLSSPRGLELLHVLVGELLLEHAIDLSRSAPASSATSWRMTSVEL